MSAANSARSWGTGQEESPADTGGANGSGGHHCAPELAMSQPNRGSLMDAMPNGSHPHSRNGEGEPSDVEKLTKIQETMRTGKVVEAMNELLPFLQARRMRLADREWQDFARLCLRHPLRELVHQDPFTYRAFSKPRGYAGDAQLLDFIYGQEEGWRAPDQTTELGRKLFDYTTHSSACEAVRARRGFLADLVDRLVEDVPRPHILSVAAGHLREVLLSAALKRRKVGRYVAVDSDVESLEEVKRCYARYGVEIVAGSVRQILTHKLDLGVFDLVYSTGLFDYLTLEAGKRLTWAMFQMLRPQGRLLVANFLPGIPDVGYMESYMDWKLIYRTRHEMVALSEEIPQSQIRDLHIFAEENQNIIFLQVTKR
jgi:hypothetical protein